MILVKRFNAEECYINSDLIETIDQAPETIITMTTGKKIIVEDTREDIVDKIIEYKRRIYCNP